MKWFGRAQNCGNFDLNFDTQPLMPTLIERLPLLRVYTRCLALLSKHLNLEENLFQMLIWIYKQYFIFRKIFGMKIGGSKFRGGGGTNKQSPVDNIYIEKYLMVGAVDEWKGQKILTQKTNIFLRKENERNLFRKIQHYNLSLL